MITTEEIKAILGRIAEDKETPSDLKQLKKAISSNEKMEFQLGETIVNVGKGQGIHIGNQVIQQFDLDTIREILKEKKASQTTRMGFILIVMVLLLGMIYIVYMDQIKEHDQLNPQPSINQTQPKIPKYPNEFPENATLLVTKLNNARLQGEEGDRQTGSFYSYNVWLEDVSLESPHDSTENNRHVQQYTIIGKWSSKVYKEINTFGLRVDTPWGSNKTPYGNFTVKFEMINERVTNIQLDVARHDDSANNYAAEKAKQLIQSKISEVLQVF
ncbi:MAG: hypothetical protein F6K40_09555 [Okeania sp. SIO3I5]|uniref:hypothetical protein n=1 Tax=Okeania sp. SIO3I5 TaxID=2607805 RepID=UPI0013BAF15C|nr:hypothetical protein [Okeania sp. SIO3I5]NEQ36509.1 hypothetical protein [Okeania sp. SIO3I5]